VSQALPADIAAESVQVLAQHGRSFRWASFFLPAERRAAAAIVYAFCRLVDDAMDEAPSAADGASNLARIEAELRGELPARPLISTFLEMCERWDIPLGAAHELIAGVRSDVGDVRLKDDRALLRYCYRVAGTVGLMMCGVLGVTDPQARAHAVDLGVGMQLTNICRDVAEDARMQRVYLPAERLEAAGGGQAALLAGEAAPAPVVAVVADLLALAERYYESADLGMRYIPLRSRLAILVAGRIYRSIGWRLLRGGGDPLQGRTVVPWTEKLVRVAQALLASLKPDILGLRAPKPHDPSLHTHLAGLPGCEATSKVIPWPSM
jgi:phytoene synthase